MCRRQFISTTKAEDWAECPLSRKNTLEEKVQKIFVQLLPKAKSTQTSESVFAERVEQVGKTKIELELTKNVDSFLDGQANYASILVSFKIKSL